MTGQTITCPSCRTSFALDESLAAPLMKMIFEAVIHHGSKLVSGRNGRKGSHGAIGKNASGISLTSEANPLVQVIANALEGGVATSRRVIEIQRIKFIG